MEELLRISTCRRGDEGSDTVCCKDQGSWRGRLVRCGTIPSSMTSECSVRSGRRLVSHSAIAENLNFFLLSFPLRDERPSYVASVATTQAEAANARILSVSFRSHEKAVPIQAH